MTHLPPLREDARLTAAVLAALDAAALRDSAAAMLVDLRSHTSGAWRADNDIYPASVIKIALMTEAHLRFANGELARDRRVAIDAANLTPTAETTPLIAAYEARVDELVELMIERSDNIATNQLIDVLHRARVNASMRALGVAGFTLACKLSGADPLVEDPAMTGRNSLRPAAAAHLLRLIALDAVPGAAEQRALLARCMHRDKFAAGLRADDRLMHKTGETSTVSHDAGILHTAQGGAYVVVLYTTLQPATSGDAASHINAPMTHWMLALRESL